MVSLVPHVFCDVVNHKQLILTKENKHIVKLQIHTETLKVNL